LGVSQFGFPVLIEADLDTGKWQKKLLAKWGSIAVDTPPDEFSWGRANAVGVPMGQPSMHATGSSATASAPF
jgi:hypothetical protein